MSNPVPIDDPFASDFYESQLNPGEDFSQRQTQSNGLQLCQLVDWDSEGERPFDEDPSIYIHYTFQWTLKVNRRKIASDTEEGVVLEPGSYWRIFVEDKLKELLAAENKIFESKDTNVVISTTARKRPDLTKRYDNTRVDWEFIESTLVAWGEQFPGKTLGLNLSFNFVETGQPMTTSSVSTKRGRSSRTQRMLAGRAMQLRVEEEVSGRPAIWAEMYTKFRCPGHPCQLGPYCWIDPDSRKHIRLLGPHIESLVDWAEAGHIVQSHDDVPDHIRQQLYTAANQSLERHKKQNGTPTANVTPFNINVLPPQSCQTCTRVSSPAGALAPDMRSSTAIPLLDVPGLLDEQVEHYCSWQQSRFKKATAKAEYKKACDWLIEEGMTLPLMLRDPNPKLLTDQGIKRGPAEHIMGDIDLWVKTKRARTEVLLD